MISVRLELDEETKNVVAYVTVDGEEHLTQGVDDIDALQSAVELIFLVKYLCPRHPDRQHCYCSEGNRYGRDGRVCCHCQAWSATAALEQRGLTLARGA